MGGTDPKHRYNRSAIAVATAVAVLLLLARFVSEPLHHRGALHGLTAYLNGLGHVLQLPGVVVAGALGLPVWRHAGWTGWLATLPINFVFYFLAWHVFLRLRGEPVARRSPDSPVAERPVGDPDESASTAPATLAPDASAGTPLRSAAAGLTRRRVLRHGTTALAAAAAAVGGYALFVEPRWFRVTRRTFPVTGLPPQLQGLRIVHLTDIHLGPWMSLGHVREVVRATNALNPDLVLLTGDFVHESPVYIRPVADALAALRPTIEAVGVLGNHDWWEDGPQVRQELTRAGIRMIDNARCLLRPNRTLSDDTNASHNGGLCLAGVGDLWEDRQHYDAVLGDLPTALPRLLLSHNPDVAEEPGLRPHRVDLMLSGHTHGGQVWVPGLGTPVVPSRFGQKYAHGLVQGPACPVFISSGIGMAVLPLRLRVPPEIAVIELQRG